METKTAKEYLKQFRPDPLNTNDVVLGVKDGKSYLASQIMQSFANEQTTSQQQTIERLKKCLGEFKNMVYEYSSYITNAVNDDYKRKLEAKIEKMLDKSEQLLNTTEPKTEDELLEEKTDHNANVISSFMEHCKNEGLEIPDSFFESYFDA